MSTGETEKLPDVFEKEIKLFEIIVNKLPDIVRSMNQDNTSKEDVKDLMKTLYTTAKETVLNQRAAPLLGSPVIQAAPINPVAAKEKEALPPDHPDFYAVQYRKIGSILRGLGIQDKAELESKMTMFSFYKFQWDSLKGNIPDQVKFCRVYAKEILEVNDEFNRAKKSGLDLAKFAADKLAVIDEKHKKMLNEIARSIKNLDEGAEAVPVPSDQPWPDDEDVAMAQPAKQGARKAKPAAE